ncbi:hypothetical protein LDENG_00261860, partial [Lucifuga dentata]
NSHLSPRVTEISGFSFVFLGLNFISTIFLEGVFYLFILMVMFYMFYFVLTFFSAMVFGIISINTVQTTIINISAPQPALI